MEQISGRNVPEAYLDGIWRLKISGREEESRNGRVLTIPSPVLLTIYAPWERVLIDDERQANPYFHLAEFVWMMAGSKDANWLAKYNKQMLEYSDDGRTLDGAYGYRWAEHFGLHQIYSLVKILRKDSESRRAVLAMWDPTVDLRGGKDIPCNTHVYFRMNGPTLDMTVCNRSNDFIWGMLGANAVHMTMLHELICNELRVRVGKYQVFTNNLHIYKSLPKFKEIMSTTVVEDLYRSMPQHIPLVFGDETMLEFIDDCDRFVFCPTAARDAYSTNWFRSVFIPMMAAYELRRNKKDELEMIEQVAATDWRVAAYAWRRWKSV